MKQKIQKTNGFTPLESPDEMFCAVTDLASQVQCKKIQWKRKHSLTGFTLVELLFAVSFLAIFIISTGAFWLGMTNLWHDNTAKVNTVVSAKKALTHMSRELRRAQLSSLVISGSQNNRTVVFQTPYQSCDSNGNNCQWLFGADGTQNGTIRYYLNNGTLIRETRAADNSVLSQRNITNGVTALEFQQVNNDAYFNSYELNNGTDEPHTYEMMIACVKNGAQDRSLTTSLTSRITMRIT
ncbi:MAG: hypothetical protein COV74_06245 [Candidatus Omnitrophica bacterium CG11_big_fil_rev_8_21_14_0_20_45_26]|uniref:Uncharacterized protein n=1 Tax=Candidatus Abzuiibacterium crystallinum TaxID=1974748 RepID=A0A2H0LNN8_9BACT|nr:MAG: hypothetical protein COV74_06245 [Candidatus Omnitrophica bacterium CG11_big_fil_rev_8_21_14_0_20_45_26]PIW65644.1 MAG: hypothetical protein COW12_00625 [Candidatus Omnitrophica bacterium CG12_big_fil_rev_8_21_14_0_65_45_16]